MKKHIWLSMPIFVLLALSLALFIHLYVLNVIFTFKYPFWSLTLLFSFDLAVISLGLTWGIYSKIISKVFGINFKEVLTKDLYSYFPLTLLLFYFINIEQYTKEYFSAKTLCVFVVFLIIILKVATILNIKLFSKKYSYGLYALAVILPFGMINYFVFSYYSNNFGPKSFNPVNKSALEGLYDADPLSLFSNSISGVYKKKIEIASDTRNALVLLPPKQIEVPVTIPAESYLQFGFGAWEDSYTGEGDGIRLTVFLKSKNNTKTVYDKYIDPKHYERDHQWFDAKIDLRDYARQEVSIIFEASGSPNIQPPFRRSPDNRDDYAAVSDPKIVPYNPQADPSKKNVIFISIDTLRADHLACYGYKRRVISPNIDRLAGEGILFENAISQAPWTTPSHMTMFTSLLPSYHHVNESFSDFIEFWTRREGYRILSQDIPTMPKVFKSAGYTTAAFTGGGCVTGRVGFCLGFDSYKEENTVSFASEGGFNELAAWLETHKNTPFFLFLHTFRVHAPYTGFTYTHELMTESEIDELNKLTSKLTKSVIVDVDSLQSKLEGMDFYEKEVTENLYDGGIYETDEYIGKLTETLRKTALLNSTIIVLTSDHGEEFGDHTATSFYNAHGITLYNEMVHVPLIFVIPGFPKAKRIEYQVRHIDIMPTLLNLCGINYETVKMQGISLLPMLNGEKPEHELVAISEAMSRGPEEKSIRTSKAKYIYTVNLNLQNGKHAERTLASDHPDSEELYDVASDSGEKYNLISKERDLSNSLKTQLNDTLKDAVRALSTGQKDRRLELDESKKNQLKALGYIQ